MDIKLCLTVAPQMQYFSKYRLVFNIKEVKIMALSIVSLARRHFLSCWLPVPNNTSDTVCALEKLLLLHNRRFNHQEQRCGTKGEPFSFSSQKNMLQKHLLSTHTYCRKHSYFTGISEKLLQFSF